jgi:hypothetical protein
MRPFRLAVAGLAALVLAAGACAPRRVGLAGAELVREGAGPFRKVLVVGMSRAPDVRERIERELSANLSAAGTEAVAASSYFGLAAEPPSREEVRAVVDRDGYDGIVLARLAAHETRYRPVPAGPHADPFWPRRGFYDTYWGAWPHVYAPTYLEAVRTGALEVRLYEAGGAGRLVYQATSDRFELRDAARALSTVSEALAGRLVAERLLGDGAAQARPSARRSPSKRRTGELTRAALGVPPPRARGSPGPCRAAPAPRGRG